MKNVFAKILVLVLCLTFVISGLAGCKTDDQIADIQNQLDQNKNDDKADAAALAELKTLVEQIKSTADSAATAAALQEVVDNLAGVKATADAAATAAKLAEVEEALKALVNTNDATLKAELEAAIAAVKVTAEAAATKAAFDAAITELQTAIATEKDAVAKELAEIKNSIAAGKTERDALDAAIKALASTVATNKTDLEKSIANVAKTVADNKKALEESIAAVKAIAEAAATKGELATTKEALEAAISALATSTAADLDAAIKNVKALITANGEADETTKTELNKALDEVKATATANKTELEGKITALENVAATSEALNAAVAELNGKIAKVEADAATKVALDALNKTVANNKAELEAAIAAVKATADAAATKEALEAAIADLNAKITANGTNLTTEVGKLEAAIKANADAIEAAKEAVKTELEGKITALETALNKDIADIKTAVEKNTDDIADALAGVAAAATKKELNDAIAAVKAIAEAAATKGELAATKEALEAAIAAVKTIAEAAATKGELAATKEALDAAIEDVKALITANGEADEAAKLELNKALDEVKATATANKAELDAAIAAVKAIAEAAATKGELTTTKEALEAAISALATTTAADLNAAIEGVKALITANGEADDTTKTELNKALDEVKATANDNKTELEAAIAAVKATADAAVTKSDLEAAIAALNDKITANITTEVDKLEAAINANVENIAKNVEAIAANAGEIENIKTEIATLKDTITGNIEAAIASVKAELEGKITALETKVDDAIAAFTEQITALQGKDAELATTLDTLKKQVEDLENAFDEQHNAENDFATQFVNATEVLSGEAKLVIKLDMDGNIEKIVVVDKESNIGDFYSIAAFEAITVDERFYIKGDYDNFISTKENLKFFLNRAISPEAIVNYFRQLQAYIADMPDLNETLAKLLVEKTHVTTAVDDLKQIQEVVDKMVTQNAEMTAENKTAYDAVVAAHTNLLNAVIAADAVEAEIEKIGYVVYTASEELIATAETAVDTFKTEYFAKEAFIKYYTVDETDVVENYEVLTTARARYEQLVAANANKITVIETAMKFGTVRPLWTDKVALDANFAAFQAWCADYNVDEKADAASILTIYPVVDDVNPIDSLKLAKLYADAMNTVYTSTAFAEDIVGVEALNKVVADLMAANEGEVLYEDYAVAKGYEKNYMALEAAIKFNKQYDATVTDNNYAEMTKAVAENFAKYMERQEVLNNTNISLDGFYTAITKLFGTKEDGYKVTFNDWTAIDQYGKDIAVIIEDAGVEVGDANYVAFAAEKDPFAVQADLVAEYLALTAKVREIYDTVKTLMGNSHAMSLAFGNDITEFIAELTRIMDLKVTNIDLPLPGKDASDNANLSDLMTDLENVIDQFVEKAEAAQADAVEVSAAIATLTNYKVNNLNDYASIVAVGAVLNAWIDEYLAADVELAEGDVLKAIQSVAETQVYLATKGTFYVYVIEADYTACVTAMTAANAHYDAAKAAWATVSAELERLTALEWNIHDKAAFEAADAAYLAYIKAYYTETGITIADGVFDELAVYAAFVTERNACYAMATEAVGKIAVIEALIKSLAPAITASNYAAQLDIIAEANAAIEAYKNYCTDICDECISEALRITLAEKEATAKLYEYAEAAKVITNDATDEEINKSIALYSGMILGMNDGERDFGAVIAGINSTLETAKSHIDKKAPCAVPGATEADHKDADDHKCDYCDTKITDCEVTDLKTAHECTICDATSDCVVELGTAHECTCGATSDCPVVAGTAHECDVCDKTTECPVDAGTAYECDVCGKSLS